MKKNEWSDVMVTGVSRVLTHVPLGAYADRNAAARGGASPFRLCLDGSWRFQLTSSPDAMPGDFLDEAETAGDGWLDMPVPSNWQLDERVADQPIYTNTPYPFEGAAPLVPDVNPTGWYRHSFEVPAGWGGREIFLHFGSCDSACKLWVNSVEAGYSEDSKLPHEFNVTALVKPGRNRLSVMVPRYCTGFWLECQDYWHLSGIQRSVTLFSKPLVHIRDFAVQTVFDDAFLDAQLRVRVFLNPEADFRGYAVAIRLIDAGGLVVESDAPVPVADRTPMYTDFHLERGSAYVQLPVPSPRIWTAETPHLYTLVISLVDPSGAAVDFERCRLGFRQVEIRDGVLCLNGRRMIVRGVNDHEHHPERGRSLTGADMRDELVAMKRLNFNAVRTSHYPHDDAFYDLCDELGLYVVDEANLETHGVEAQITKDPLWMNAFMERAQRMALRDRNHPCVVIWSLGNESYHGPHHAAMAAWLRHLDPTRPVQYESGFPGPAITDIMAPMYPKLDWVEAKLAEAGETRPMILCEYAYSKGNALGNFHNYWDLTERLPRFQGGFIWDWRDKALVRRVHGRLEWAYGNEFDAGIGPDGYAYGKKENPQMCLNGVVQPDLTPKPGAWEVMKVQAPVQFAAEGLATLRDGRVVIRNRYLALGLDHLALQWELTVNGEPVQQGQLVMPSVAPAGDAEVQIPFTLPSAGTRDEIWLNLDAVQTAATDWSEAGHVVAWEQFALHAEAEAGDDPVPAVHLAAAEAPRVDEDERWIRVIVAGGVFWFDRARGVLARWQGADGQELLQAPLEPCFMRARTDNDDMVGKPGSYYDEWRRAGLDRLTVAVVDCRAEAAADEGVVTVHCVTRHAAPPAGGASILCTVIFRIDAAGRVKVVQSVDATGVAVTTLPRVGMRTALAQEFDRLAWYGRGPHENYPDRKTSARVGCYTGTVADSFFPFVDPGECGGHQDTRWVRVQREDGRGLLVEGSPLLHFSALPYPVEALLAAGHVYELPGSSAVALHLDGFHLGLGGDTGWTQNVHPEYLLPPGPYEWEFGICADSLRFGKPTTRGGRAKTNG